MVSQQAFSVGHFSGVDALQHKMVLRLVGRGESIGNPKPRKEPTE